MIFLDTPEAEPFKELGSVTTKRASHVEPYEFLPRLAFAIIRMLVSDSSKTAEWTRNWMPKGGWRVNTNPYGGPILTWGDILPIGVPYPKIIYRWQNRRYAIKAEIKFLNEFFLRGKR